MLDVGDFFACALAQSAMEDEEVAVAEYDAAFEEGGMFARFAVKCAGHLWARIR